MIVWSSGGDVVSLGVLDTRQCETCGQDRPFNITLQYRYFALYWVFSLVTKKQYLLVCSVCGRGWELERGKVEPTLKAVPIPFMRRYGMLTLVGGLVVLGILGSYVG